jgi:Tfp pilus assembly protein PilO
VKLLKRILVEKRAIVIPLVIAALANIGVYALVVYPLNVKAATAADRAAAAAEALKAAERDEAAARALVVGKSRADQELATFYDRMLPASLAAARNLTYTRVPALAQKANVRMVSRKEAPDQAVVKEGRVGRLETRIILQGDYDGIRRFIYALETAPEFVIIDDVALAQPEASKALNLTLELSTYYRLGANGT